MAKIVSSIWLSVVIQVTLPAPDPHSHGHRHSHFNYADDEYVKPVGESWYDQIPAPSSISANDEDIPEECRHLDYCTVKPNDYPDFDIKQLFKNKKVALPPPDLEVKPFIVNRLGDPDEEDNCPSHVTYEPIYKLKHNAKWRVVVQAPDLSYEQKVRMERCLYPPGKACFTIATFPSNVRTKCVQNFSTWKLQILDDNKKATMKEVNLPSCCSCHFEYVNN